MRTSFVPHNLRSGEAQIEVEPAQAVTGEIATPHRAQFIPTRIWQFPQNGIVRHIPVITTQSQRHISQQKVPNIDPIET